MITKRTLMKTMKIRVMSIYEHAEYDKQQVIIVTFQ